MEEAALGGLAIARAFRWREMALTPRLPGFFLPSFPTRAIEKPLLPVSSAAFLQAAAIQPRIFDGI
jgi:hypothetical protein